MRNRQPRPRFRGVISAATAVIVLCAGCVPAIQPECIDLEAPVCEAVWAAAQPELRPLEGVREARIEHAGGAAECFPGPCNEMYAVSISAEQFEQVIVVERIGGRLAVTESDFSEVRGP